MSHKNVIEINDGIFNFIKNKTNCTISAFYYCPHHWNTNCECRKPKIKNFIKAHKDFNVNFENSIFIGDRKTDENCAKNLDIKYVDYKKIKSSSQLIKIIKSKLKI